MTSPLPPKRRDSVNLANMLRQDRQRLSQLDRGLVFGKFPPARPLKPRWDDGGEDDDLDEVISFWNTDRVAAKSAGTITLLLTYEPLDGSLHIRWNGIDQPPAEWRLDGRVVTFTDPHIHVGDVLTAAYAYIEPDAATSTSLESLVLRGVTTHTGALPVETQVGDFVVVATRGGFDSSIVTFDDPRFPMLNTPGTEGKVYAGVATDIDPLVRTSGTGYVVVASFVGGAAVSTVAFDTDPAYPAVGPQPGNAAVAVANERSSSVAGSISLPTPPWQVAGSDQQLPEWTEVRVWYWSDPTAASTPDATASASGGVDETEVFVLTLTGVSG